MGDAADDAFDAAMFWQQQHENLIAAGCKPCEQCCGEGVALDKKGNTTECPKCAGFGWFNKDGTPTEI